MRHPLTIIVQGRVKFQSTHSLRSATVRDGGFNGFRNVSIHALLAECDWTEDQTPGSWKSFNPRTPCGVRLVNKVLAAKRNEFQSTHSLRSATWSTTLPFPRVSGFNPRTPCGVRLFMALRIKGFQGFNPRTPCGVRLFMYFSNVDMFLFQSTHSLRSATVLNPPLYSWSDVSIHALLAECDRFGSARDAIGICFNPRTPCGVRHFLGLRELPVHRFQSTHSLRSATAPDHIHCYSTAQTILCANLPKKAIIT